MKVATRFYAVTIARVDPDQRIEVLDQIPDSEIKLADGTELLEFACLCGTSPSPCCKWINPRDIVDVP